jgi:transposase
LWHRDINAAINMITIMTRTLTNKPLGAFEKKK